MTQKKLASITAVMVVLLVLAVFVMFYAVMEAAGGGTADVYTYITAMAYSLTGLFAVYYIVAGCKKDSAGYFVWCTVAFAVCCVLAYFRVDEMSPHDGLFNCLVFGALSVLSMAKDLGEKKSKTLAIIVVVLSIIALAKSLMDGFLAVSYPVVICNLVYSLNVLFMVTAKYFDKASRGSN